MSKKEIVVRLSTSTFAHDFGEKELIHATEYERALKLVDDRVKEARKWNIDDGKQYMPSYDTISIFGERGTGKTSFLLSLLEKIGEKYRDDVLVLNVVDPTMIEEKEHIFLLIIALISKEVENKISREEGISDTKSYENRTIWSRQLMKLAKGLPTLGNVGTDHKNSLWQDHDFIMERGLKDVLSAFSLRTEFYRLVSLALRILGKKAFVLALDDIDVDMQKGWDVLEMLRKYVNTPQIITVLSGNWKLYSMNVRRNQWVQLKTNKENDRDRNYGMIVNELEGQYLLKVLRTENRIHLQSLLQLLQYGHQYKVETTDGHLQSIKEMYRQILTGLGIKGYTQQTIFRDYLLSLSVRSQIQFLKNNSTASEERTWIENIEAFLSRLYAANVDVETAANNVNMLNLIIQGYIEHQPSTPELYLLSPSYESSDMNACLTAFTILFAKSVKKNPFLIFDYFVRMGYIRNVLLGMSSHERTDFFARVGLVQNMSLKNNVGLSMGYSVQNSNHKLSHIELLGLAEKNKGSAENDKERIDAVVKGHANQAQAIIAYLPISVLKYTYKHESQVYYSIYNLMACISELLQNAVSDEDNAEERKTAILTKIKSLLINLQQLRTYTVLTRQGDLQTRHIGETGEWNSEQVEESLLPDDNSIEILAEAIYEWMMEYDVTLPPYLIGKIATRLYYTVHKISKEKLGDQMHRTVMALLHACLIEEALEYYEKKDGKKDVTKIITSNVVNDDRYFIDNLRFIVDNDAIDQIPFTVWMIHCPLLWAFTNTTVLKEVKKIVNNESDGTETVTEPFAPNLDEALNVYELLNRVLIKDVKDPSKPVFSGSKTGIFETSRLLREHGIDIAFILNAENDTRTVSNTIATGGVFQNKPSKNQIEKFRANYHLVEERGAPAAEATEASADTGGAAIAADNPAIEAVPDIHIHE